MFRIVYTNVDIQNINLTFLENCYIYSKRIYGLQISLR